MIDNCVKTDSWAPVLKRAAAHNSSQTRSTYLSREKSRKEPERVLKREENQIISLQKIVKPQIKTAKEEEENKRTTKQMENN